MKKYLHSTVSNCCSQGSVILLDTPQAVSGCIVGAHVKQQQQMSVDCTRLGSLSVTSLTQASSKQHPSLESASIQQMGASVPLRRESPNTITCHLFLVVLAITWGADWLPYSAPVSLLIWQVFPFQSAEQ